MATGTPRPTILDPYLPSGITRLIVFPTPSTAKTVIAIDLDDSTSEYYTTYPGSIIDLTSRSLVELTKQVESTGQELGIIPGLAQALKRFQRHPSEWQSGRFYQRTMEISSLGQVPNTAIAGAGAFAAVGIGATSLIGWEFWAAIPAVVAGMGTYFGLHLNGMHRDGHDQTARAKYDIALRDDEHVMPLSIFPGDLIGTIRSIHTCLSTLRSIGLSTDEHHSAVTQELETFFRSTHTKLHHDAEVVDLDRRLKDVTQDDIHSDHHLFLAANRRAQHLAKRNAAALDADYALQRLHDLDTTTMQEARTAKAKLAAVEYLSKKPNPR